MKGFFALTEGLTIEPFFICVPTGFVNVPLHLAAVDPICAAAIGRSGGERGIFTSFFPSTGITPPCYSLFALYDPQSRVWLPPNHLFHIDKDTDLNLLFRMR